MIWIIGGTSEGRKIVERIKDLDRYIITIATDSGKEFFNTRNLSIGRMTYEEMVSFGLEHKISLIVDLTHPYAKIVSDNGKKVAKELNIPYIRYVREKIEKSQDAIYLNSYEECYEYLSQVKGTVFLTTGSKNIKDFEKIKGENRFVYRILPALESLQICSEYSIPMKDIVAILGPFSKDFNKFMLEEYKADYCVMKDSGSPGGTLEKVQACEELSIKPIIIGREDEEGIYDLKEIEEIIRNEHTRLEAENGQLI